MTSGKPENPALLVDVQQMPGDVFTTVKQRIEAARARCKCKDAIKPGDASPVQRMERLQRGREMPWIRKREGGVVSKPDLGYWFITEDFIFQDDGISNTVCGSYPETYPDIYSDGSGPGILDARGEGDYLWATNSSDMEPDLRNIWPMYYGKAEGVGKFYTSAGFGNTSSNSDRFNGIGNEPYVVCDEALEPWKDVSDAPYHTAKCASPRSRATAEIGFEYIQGKDAVTPYRNWGNSPYGIGFYRNIGSPLYPEYAVTSQKIAWQNWAGFREQDEERHTNCGSYKVEGIIFTGRHASYPDQLLAMQKGRAADSITYLNSHFLRAKYANIRLMVADIWSGDPFAEEEGITNRAQFYVNCRQMGTRFDGVNREFEVGDKVRLGCHALVRPGESRETDMYVGTIVNKFLGSRNLDVGHPDEYDCEGIHPVNYIRFDITGQQPYNERGVFDGDIGIYDQPMCGNYEDYKPEKQPSCDEEFYRPWREALEEYREAKKRGETVRPKKPSSNALLYGDDLQERLEEQNIDLHSVAGPGFSDQRRRHRKYAPESANLLEWIEYKSSQYLDQAAEKLGKKYGNLKDINISGPGLKNIFDEIDIPTYVYTQIARPWNDSCTPNKFGLFSNPDRDVTYVVAYETGTEQQLLLGMPGLRFAAQWFGVMVEVFPEGTPLDPKSIINKGGWWEGGAEGWIVEDTEGNQKRTPVQEFGKLNHWHLVENQTTYMGSHNGMAYFRQHMLHEKRPTDGGHYLDNLPFTKGIEKYDWDKKEYWISDLGYPNEVTPANLRFSNTSSSAPYTHLVANTMFPHVGTWSEPVSDERYARRGGWWEGTGKPHVYGNGNGDSVESVNFGPYLKSECLYNGANGAWKNCGAPECHWDVRYFEWDLENGKMNNETEWKEIDYQGQCGEREWMQEDQGYGWGVGGHLHVGMQSVVKAYHYDLWKLEADLLPDWIPWKKARQAEHNITWCTNADNSLAFKWVAGAANEDDTSTFSQSKPFLYQWPVIRRFLRLRTGRSGIGSAMCLSAMRFPSLKTVCRTDGRSLKSRSPNKTSRTTCNTAKRTRCPGRRNGICTAQSGIGARLSEGSMADG